MWKDHSSKKDQMEKKLITDKKLTVENQIRLTRVQNNWSMCAACAPYSTGNSLLVHCFQSTFPNFKPTIITTNNIGEEKVIHK